MTESTHASDSHRIGQLISGRWRLERVVGSGATSTVYAAKCTEHGDVAIKMLSRKAASRPDMRQRLAREAEVSRLLSHPSLVSVFEYDATSPTESYLVMELVAGESLASRIGREPRLSLDELLRIAHEILDVLCVAHSAGIVHRDVKPANILLVPGGGLKLLDFGIARIVGQALPDLPTVAETQLGVALGTVPYMAPEQALGQRDAIDGRTDLFGVGAVLFRAWSGRHVHQADSPSMHLRLAAAEPAMSIRTLCPDCPGGLAAIVDQALRFSQAARYPDAVTMRRDVAALLSGRAPPFATSRELLSEKATVLPSARPPEAKSAEPATPTQGGTSTHGSAREGTILADRYRIEQLLGEGGMGSVYRAEHIHIRKAVAIKILHRELTYQAEAVARFEREAIAAARIDHPNVVTAKDFGQLEDGSFYLVLQYVEGMSLRKVLKGGSLEPRRAVDIARQVAAALHAAHDAGIVHRDLKPENVMLLDNVDGGELVKVLDFGIAKLQGQEGGEPVLTRAGAVFGTPDYMSPEQSAGRPVDERSDLYTVGILLYEMLVGQAPFTGTDMLAILTAQLTQTAPTLPNQVDARIRDLVSRLLAKEPEVRPATAEHLLAELDEIAKHLHERSQLSNVRLSADAAREAVVRAKLGSLHAFERIWVQRLPLRNGIMRAITLRVRVGKRVVPAWRVGAGALALGGALVLVPALWSSPQPKPPTATKQAARAPVHNATVKLAELTAGARNGDTDSLRALERLPEPQLGAQQWLALGIGRARLQKIESSLGAYRRATELDSKLRQNPQLLKDVHAAFGGPQRELALELAASRLGRAGAELLYLDWTSWRKLGTKEAKLHTQDAFERLVSEQVKSQMSAALSVAMALHLAHTCHDYKATLERAATDADQRSEPILRSLTHNRGCGFLGLGDCFGCLRSQTSLLSTAIRKAQSTSPPSPISEPVPSGAREKSVLAK